MKQKNLWSLLSSLVALLIFATTSAEAQTATSETWMRDYVRLRIAARTLAAVQQGFPAVRSGDVVTELFQPRIVGGTIASATDNPFQVALLQRNVANNQNAQFCGGTLVRDNFVVTAAHCSDFVAANQVQILTGARRLDGPVRDATFGAS